MRATRRGGLWAVAGVIGMALVIAGTKPGIGTFGDSITYYTAAKTFAAGHGFKQSAADGTMMPLLQFPPGYPIWLTLAGWLRGDLLAGARDINVLAFGLSIFLVGYIIYRLTRSATVSGLTALLYAVHGQAMSLPLRMYSEPAYTLLVLAVMAVMIRFRPRGGWLAIAGLIAGAAALTRFAGVQMIAACTLWVLYMNWPSGWRTTAKRLGTFLLPALGPTVAWSIFTKKVAGRTSSRVLEYHPPTFVEVKTIFDTMKHWVIPIEGNWQLGTLYFVLALWLIIPLAAFFMRGLSRRGVKGRLLLLVLVVMTYVPFLLLARTFLDPAIPFNYRLLGPIHPLTLIVVATWLTQRWKLLRRHHTWPMRSVAAVVALVLMVLFVQQAQGTYALAQKCSETGLGYATPAWTNSAGIAAIRALPADAIIFTNAADAVYLLAGRDVRQLPHSYSRFSKGGKVLMQHGLNRLNRSLRSQNAVIVFFKTIKRDRLLVNEKQILAVVRDLNVQPLADARIYSVRANPATRPAATQSAPATAEK